MNHIKTTEIDDGGCMVCDECDLPNRHERGDIPCDCNCGGKK